MRSKVISKDDKVQIYISHIQGYVYILYFDADSSTKYLIARYT
jgi:hypothetical protein